MTRSGLVEVLGRVGRTPLTMNGPDGATVVALPHGGRVIGLYPGRSDRNFLWTHPALEKADTAAAFFGGDQWHNTGGDRTWVAPEVDFFFPNYPDLDAYHQPRQLDPGDYRVVNSGQQVAFENEFCIKSFRSKRELGLTIRKSVQPVANPLRPDAIPVDPDALEYAGYTLRTSLEIQPGTDAGEDCVGLWNLLQLPHGGELLIPTHSRTEPTVYFGEVPQQDLFVDEHLIRYKMRARGGQKIGIRAAAVVGGLGYIYESGGAWAIVVRSISVDPAAEYVDVPWGDTDHVGCAVQACNIDTDLGRFSEMEYHVPAIGGETGRTSCEDVSEVWAFRGTAEVIRGVAEALLSLQRDLSQA